MKGLNFDLDTERINYLISYILHIRQIGYCEGNRFKILLLLFFKVLFNE